MMWGNVCFLTERLFCLEYFSQENSIDESVHEAFSNMESLNSF